jgi:hypothetical protein
VKGHRTVWSARLSTNLPRAIMAFIAERLDRIKPSPTIAVTQKARS